jgi:hypothetical protein
MKRAVVAMLLFASSAFAARDPAKYDVVLLPFSGVTSGYGGSWAVEWWFHNDGDAPVDVFPLATSCGICPPAGRISITGPIPPHTTPRYFPGDVTVGPLAPMVIPVEPTPPGVLLYVERGKADQLTITGFLGRSNTFSGSRRRSVSTALRAVPESRFRRGRQSILLPAVAGSRYMLRIYALPSFPTAFTVRSISVSEMLSLVPSGDQLLRTDVVELFMTPSFYNEFRSQCASPCDVPFVFYKPAAGEIALQLPAALVRIEIEPSLPDVKWWAVVSATSTTDEVQFFETSDF